MPEHARRFIAPPYDQFENEDRVADWGGDDLFTRTPRRRALALVEPPQERRNAAGAVLDQRSGVGDRRRAAPTAEEAMLQRAERLGLAAVAPAPEPGNGLAESGASIAPAPASGPRWDAAGALSASQPAGREVGAPTDLSSVAPRALPIVRAERHPPSWTPADWIRARPERIVGWAFALGLLLILIAISTADAATL